jgi:hypothetical protein
VYMARSFVIHAALTWDEDDSDNMTFWRLTLDHAAWLYTRVLQRFCGLTFVERSTSNKADHRDLSRTHMWGFPYHVLDVKL